MDIEDLDAGRLCNVVYATLVDDFGPMADRGKVREHIDGVLNRPPKVAKGRKGIRRVGQGLSVEQAAKMAADLLDYDAKAAKGKVDG